MSFRFKSIELQHFNWIFNNAPCFPVHSSKISIITDPNKFYETLYEKFTNAKRRISIASLYIGTGELEKKLMEVTAKNAKQQELDLKVLLDYQRGTRGEVNSRTLFKTFVDNASNNCRLGLYQTPKLRGNWSKALPSRYNEVIGLQHMKLYIADDVVILSGANCSNDYFQQRQDRYFQIEDKDLVNYYCEIIDEVINVSKQDVGDRSIEPKEVSNEEFEKNIINLIEKWKLIQAEKLSKKDSTNNVQETWIFPLIQMGEFNITQDEQTTCKILMSAPEGSYFRLATGYFNLTDNYEKVLLKDCKSNISLLMAHPNANGFLGAPGPAGGIPHAYSLIARKFLKKIIDLNQTSRVNMLEYARPGWTFHAKGLWYYPPGSSAPWATVVGSANLGSRSVRRDLEAQAAIFTECPDLQRKLQEECSALHAHATECGEELVQRKVPLWVRASVRMFRTYF